MTVPAASRWFRWSLVIGLTLLLTGLWRPRTEHPLLRQAQDAYGQGDFLRAAQLYTQALDHCSDAGHVLFNRAAALCQAHAEDLAACDFQQLQANGPLHRRVRASYDRGNCLLRLACTRPGDRTAWLQQAIQAYETALELGRDTDSPVCHDARHNLALARKLLTHEQQARAASDQGDPPDSRDPRGDRPEPDATADRLLADASTSRPSSPVEKPSPHQPDPQGQPEGQPTDPRSGQPEETCSVCQGDCDKECSACKKCQGKQGSQAGTTGQGQQPTPGQGAAAGRQGGQQPVPAGSSSEKGQRGSTSGTDGHGQPKSSRDGQGGQPGDTPGTPRPGSIATRPESSTVGGLGAPEEASSPAAQSGLPSQGQASSSPAVGNAPGSNRSASGTAPADPSSSPQGARSGSASHPSSLFMPPTTGDRAVVELFFPPDSSPLPQRSRSTAAVPPGPRGSPPPPADSPAAVQAQRQLRSVVQRIEQARRQRLKAADVWRDHPRAQPDFKDW